MIMKLFLASTFMYLFLTAEGQNDNYAQNVSEISHLVKHFDGTDPSYFLAKKAGDSILFLLNNKEAILEKNSHKSPDVQKLIFDRILLSLDLFFPAEEIEAYAFDSVYRGVPFLWKIYSQYLNYPAKNINSFSSQESVELMYQAELYIYFVDDKTFIKCNKAVLDYLQKLNHSKKPK